MSKIWEVKATKAAIEPFAKGKRPAPTVLPGQQDAPKYVRGYSPLNNRPANLVHNHERRPRMQYMGFSETAPELHLFRCMLRGDPPRRKVELVPFVQARFTPDSKAGRGGCSLRWCPGEGLMMDKQETTSYCGRCAEWVQGKAPCPSTTTLSCHRRLRLSTPCRTCEAFEEVA